MASVASIPRALLCAGLVFGVGSAAKPEAECAADTFSTLQAVKSSKPTGAMSPKKKAMLAKKGKMPPALKNPTALEDGTCADQPSDWEDSDGDSCEDYAAWQWCTVDGQAGPGWGDDYGSFEDYIGDAGRTALQACCACGGGGPPRQCYDIPNNWRDLDGDNCRDYEENQYCTVEQGYGVGWGVSWGSFSQYERDGVSAKRACCACGGGSDPYPPPLCKPTGHYCSAVCLAVGTPSLACKSKCAVRFKSMGKIFKEYCKRGVCSWAEPPRTSIEDVGDEADEAEDDEDEPEEEEEADDGVQCLRQTHYCRSLCRAVSRFDPQAKKKCRHTCRRHFHGLRTLFDQYCEVGACEPKHDD